MMMRQLPTILLFLCLLLACGGRDGQAAFLLDGAERLMEEAPDSALRLLCQIRHPEHLSGRQQADYALLLTQARDKNYLDSLQSDSLIRLAVDYYRAGSDRAKRGSALYYYAKVLAMQGEEERAMQLYLEAQSALEGTREYKMQGFVQNAIGRLNDDCEMYDMALESYRKAAALYQKAGDTLGVIYIYRNIAWINEARGKNDSVQWYVGQARKMLHGDSSSVVLPSLLQLQGKIEMKRGNYAEAVNCLQFAIRHERNRSSIPYYYMSLGTAYLHLRDYGKAEMCFNHALGSADLFAQSGGYKCLSLLEKQRFAYEKSLVYKEKSDSLWKIAQSEEQRSSLLEMQRRHEVEKMRLKKKIGDQHHLLQLYLAGFAFVGLIVVGILLYWGVKKRFLRVYRARLKEHSVKVCQKIADNERLIGQYICQIEDLQQKELELTAETKEQVGTLKQEIWLLHQENKKMRDESCVAGMKVLKLLREHQLIIKNMTLVEKAHLFEYADLLFDGFVTRLREEYKLKDVNLPLPVLIKLGFSAEELAFLFDCELEAVWKRKQRFKTKLGLDGAVDLDSFLLFYPRKCPAK